MKKGFPVYFMITVYNFCEYSAEIVCCNSVSCTGVSSSYHGTVFIKLFLASSGNLGFCEGKSSITYIKIISIKPITKGFIFKNSMSSLYLIGFWVLSLIKKLIRRWGGGSSY